MIGNIVAGTFSAGVAPSTTSYESIATALGTGSSGTITFNTIPSTYKHLQIRIYGFQATNNDIFLKLNTDTGARQHWLLGSGSTPTSSTNTGAADGQYFGTTGFSSSNPTVYIVDILDYVSTSKAKTVRSIGGYDANGSGRINILSHLFTTTSAIDTITFKSGNSFSTGSSFALYGVKD